jgi:prepilin-type N-terminal cleavage/methylation domain-containing protein
MSRTGVSKIGKNRGRNRDSTYLRYGKTDAEIGAVPIYSRGFTLIEVLTAVMILSIGIVGVVRAYITLINGIEASSFTVQASYLLKAKMADIEKEAIENPGVSSGTRNGSFGADYPGFRWEYTATDVLIGTADKAKDKTASTDAAGAAGSSAAIALGEEVILSKIRLTVTSGNVAEHAHSLSLWTYLEKPQVLE